MSEDLRDRISKIEARQDMFEKWVGQIRIDISEIRKTMELLVDRVARLEERVNHLSERINSVEKSLSERVDSIERALSSRIDRVESEIREVRGRLWWVIGILVSMWSSTIALLIAILLKLIGFF